MHPRAKATSPTGTPGPGPRARAKATSPTGTPGPGHSNGFLWAFKAAVCQPANPPKLSKRSKPSKTRQTLQTPSPDHRRLDVVLFQTLQTFTLKQLPQQAPQGQGHSNDFLWAFKAAVCQPAKAPIPSKIPNPQGQGHSNETFYRLSKLPFASPQTLQNSPNAPNAPNPPKPAKPSKHRPQQAPQIHSNDFLEAFKAAVCQPAKAATPPKFQTPSLKQGQGHFPNRHPRARAKATSPTGTPGPGHSNGFLWAFKAAVCQPANPPKLSKRSQTLQTLQNPPNPPNTVPSRHPRSTAMTFLTLSKLQRIQTFKIPNTFPNMHPRAKATSPTGTPGPGQ